MVRSSTNTTITFKKLANVVLTIVKMINVYYAFICFCFLYMVYNNIAKSKGE